MRRPLSLAAALLLATAAPPVAVAGEPIEDAFRRGCLERERAELRGTATWAWIEELCARDADGRAAAFRAADREGRLGILAEDCADWYGRNGERLPDVLQRDPRARRAYVAFVCRREAEERLRALGP